MCEAVREVRGERAGWVGGGDRRCSALPYREEGDRLKERQRQRQLVREARRDGEDD